MILIAVAALLIHGLLFRTENLLLPKYRTGLFFIPLLTLILAASVSRVSAFHENGAGRTYGTAILAAMALYFMGCLRLNYFKEWKFDADTKQLYWTAEDIRRRCGTVDMYADWRYEAPLNFYREEYANRELLPFGGSSSGDPPGGHDVYLVFFPSTENFIERQGLRLLYRNDVSGSAIAVRGCPDGNRHN